MTEREVCCAEVGDSADTDGMVGIDFGFGSGWVEERAMEGVLGLMGVTGRECARYHWSTVQVRLLVSRAEDVILELPRACVVAGCFRW